MFSLFSSVSRVAVGVSIALILAGLTTLIRIYLENRTKLFYLFHFFFELIKFPPPIAWIPLIILFFGIGESSSWIIVAIGAFPSLSTTFYESIGLFQKNIHQFVLVLPLSFQQKIFDIYLPALLPQFFTGLRISVGMAWMCIVAAEMISSTSGLGYLIQMHRFDLDYSAVLFDIFLIGFLGFIMNYLLLIIEGYFSPWNRTVKNKYAKIS